MRFVRQRSHENVVFQIRTKTLVLLEGMWPQGVRKNQCTDASVCALLLASTLSQKSKKFIIIHNDTRTPNKAKESRVNISPAPDFLEGTQSQGVRKDLCCFPPREAQRNKELKLNPSRTSRNHVKKYPPPGPLLTMQVERSCLQAESQGTPLPEGSAGKPR
jgi:hypothetical protein